MSRKIEAVCISRMYATLHRDETVTVKYVSTHTNHDLSLAQLKFIPLPKDTKDSIAMKLNLGIPIARILDGKFYTTQVHVHVHVYTTLHVHNTMYVTF